MRISFLPFIALLVCFAGCSKPARTDIPTVPDQKPGAFTVTVIYRTETDATIQWTAAPDTPDDTIRYSVYLKGIKLDSNLAVLTDTLTKLLPDSSYKGLVIATDRKGDTSVAPFELPAFQGFLYIYDQNKSLYCYNIATGKQKWIVKNLFAVGVISPVCHQDTLFSLGTSLGIITLYAHNKQTGALIWKDTIQRNSPLSPIQTNSTLALENGELVYVIDSDIYACNSKDGHFRWRSTVAEGYSFQIQPVIAGGLVYIGGLDKKMHALDAASGVERWAFNTKELLWESNPSVANGLVYFGAESGSLFALNAGTGVKAWSMNTSADPISTSPRVEGSTLYMSMNDGSVYSLNALTGKINWQYLVPNQAMMSNPAVDNSSVYVGTWDGNRWSDLLAINKTSGALRWRIRISGANSWAMEPIAAGNRVYVYAGSYVNIYNATNGAFIKTIDIIYQLITGFAVDINDSIYYPASSPMVQ